MYLFLVSLNIQIKIAYKSEETIEENFDKVLKVKKPLKKLVNSLLKRKQIVLKLIVE